MFCILPKLILIQIPSQSIPWKFVCRNEKDVQDEEMAHFYSRRDGGASNTIGRKFATKQEYQGIKK